MAVSLFVRTFLKLMLYFFICASCAVAIRMSLKISDEVFRKLLHFILLGSAVVLLNLFDTWHGAAIAPLIFAVLVYPLLSLAEHLKRYSQFMVERDSGEIKRSLLYVFAMFSVVIAISWGFIGEKYLALAVILAWGVGDAAAALVGKNFGKRYIAGKYVDGKKTVEGSFAMFVASFAVIITILAINTTLAWYYILIVSFIAALVNSLVELNTKHGLDTITCPTAFVLVMVPLWRLMR